MEPVSVLSTLNQEEPSFVLHLQEMSRNPQLDSQKTASLKNLEVSHDKDIFNSNNSSLIAQVLPIIQQEEDAQDKKLNTMAEDLARKKSEYLGDQNQVQEVQAVKLDEPIVEFVPQVETPKKDA